MTLSQSGHEASDTPIPFKAYNGDQPYLFVSYAHKNRVIIYQDLLKLHTWGYRIWYDEGIASGSNWMEVIAKRIKLCTCFVVYFSADVLESGYVRDEVLFALKMKNTTKMVKLLPIMLDDVQLPDDLDMGLQSIQFIERHKLQPDNYWQRVLDGIPGDIMNQPGSTSPLPKEMVAAFVLSAINITRLFDDIQKSIEKGETAIAIQRSLVQLRLLLQNPRLDWLHTSQIRMNLVSWVNRCTEYQPTDKSLPHSDAERLSKDLSTLQKSFENLVRLANYDRLLKPSS